MRFDHRESVDIDLFFSGIIGKARFGQIEKEVGEKFGEAILNLDYPCDIDDQFIFQRFIVRNKTDQIRVEIMQNMIFTEQAEVLKDVRILSLHDMGLLKLMAVSNRASFKDVYDLCYLTDDRPLTEYFSLLKQKREKYNKDEHRNIFDLDKDISPVAEPGRLLNFEKDAGGSQDRPGHSTNRLKITNGISWFVAQSRWRRRVKELLRSLGKK